MAMTLRLPAELQARVARVAKEQGISINALVARAVVPYLAQHAQQKRMFTDYEKRCALEDVHFRQQVRYVEPGSDSC